MKKSDFVIEAVRYKNGKIDIVRGYQRRGPTYTDHILLDRKALLEHLKEGKLVVTGQRKEFLASTFDLGKQVKLMEQDGKQLVATLPEAEHDELEGVPLF
jgi:hypothetical protein